MASRLAGHFSFANRGERERLVDRMVAQMQPHSGWSSICLEHACGSMAWTGERRSANIAEIDGVLAVLDGRIYAAEGISQRAGNDAELLIYLFMQLGFSLALSRMNGDFAVALFDTATETLWLGRDRFGVKPLYYVTDYRGTAFASRPSGILSLPHVPSEPNRTFVALFAASHYRYFDNDPEASPYTAIKQLPAAHHLRCDSNGVEKGAYWKLEDSADYVEPEEELATRYRDLFINAVSVRFRDADKPIFTLSGGMDSSSTLACAVRLSGRKQIAVSTVYDDKTFDESEDIRSMLATKVEEWHQVRIGTPDVLDLIKHMVLGHDEPVATATWLSHFLLCRSMAEAGFASIFGGLGGDELNAGEYEYFLFHFADLRAAGEEKTLEREIGFWIRFHDHPIFRKTRDTVEHGLRTLTDSSRPGFCRPDTVRLRKYASALNPDYFSLEDFEPVMDQPFSSCLKNRAYQDMFRETLPCCLRASDRNSTYFGLDGLMPFLDHRLSEFMFRIPGSLKIRDAVTKYLLRLAMKGVLPEETRMRIKKTGWNAPAHVWFSGAGLDSLRDLVGSRTFRERGIYDVKRVADLIEEHDRIVSSGIPKENHMMFLWQLANLEIWLQSLGHIC